MAPSLHFPLCPENHLDPLNVEIEAYLAPNSWVEQTLLVYPGSGSQGAIVVLEGSSHYKFGFLSTSVNSRWKQWMSRGRMWRRPFSSSFSFSFSPPLHFSSLSLRPSIVLRSRFLPFTAVSIRIWGNGGECGLINPLSWGWLWMGCNGAWQQLAFQAAKNFLH